MSKEQAYEEQQVADKVKIYTEAVSAIASMAIAEQKKINIDENHCTERIKAYRIALMYLRPDLTSEQIYDEIERCSYNEWNCETRRYESKKG